MELLIAINFGIIRFAKQKKVLCFTNKSLGFSISADDFVSFNWGSSVEYSDE